MENARKTIDCACLLLHSHFDMQPIPYAAQKKIIAQ